MKVPLSWLKKYLTISQSPEKIGNLLTLAGLEVEKIEVSKFQFKSVIVAKIVDIISHPKTVDLQIAIVFDGERQHQIITDDFTLVKNTYAPLALIGSTILDENNNAIVISKKKINGVETTGILCTERDLGISNACCNTSNKVMIISNDTIVGDDLSNQLKDPIFDITLTPNFGHARSIIGVARELSAQLNIPMSIPQYNVNEDQDNLTSSKITITNNNPENCYQYMCRIIQGVEIEASPQWIRSLLEKAGYTSVNNVVDITNLVMHELGQPLHAFDYDKLPEMNIVIRQAKNLEEVITLDNIERTLTSNDTLICDEDVPIAIAGIMGLKNSCISESTHTILIEAAQFNGKSIRKTSRRLGLRTESSARLENGIDPSGLQLALDMACNIIQKLAGGRILKGVVENTPKPYRPHFLTCRLSKINSLLGGTFSLSEVESYLIRLGFTISSDKIDTCQLKIPSWRNDVKNEVDIIEEVARVYGYNNIEKKMSYHINSKVSDHPTYVLTKQIRSRLIANGLQELLTCNLISKSQCDLEIEHGMFNPEYIEVMYAKSEDQSILRPSLLPGLLQVVTHNQNQGINDISAFEIGAVHFKEYTGYEEKMVLGIIMCGQKRPRHWSEKCKEVDFYDVKGVIENLISSLLITESNFESSSFQTFHRGRQASLLIDDEVVGVLGEIDPMLVRKLNIKKRVLFAEINIHELQKIKPKKAIFKELPKFPFSQRDCTITIKRKKPAAAILKIIESEECSLLKKIELIDVYVSEEIGLNNKNVTIRFTYRDDNKTIDMQSVENAHQKILKALSSLSN